MNRKLFMTQPLQNTKKLRDIITDTLENRGLLTDTEIETIPEVQKAKSNGVDIDALLESMIDDFDLQFMEFQDGRWDDMAMSAAISANMGFRRVYFPNGTKIFEPGLRMKKMTLESIEKERKEKSGR